MDRTELLLKELTEAAGAPGAESGVRAVMAAHLPSYAKQSTDKLGSLIAEAVSEGKEAPAETGA